MTLSKGNYIRICEINTCYPIGTIEEIPSIRSGTHAIIKIEVPDPHLSCTLTVLSHIVVLDTEDTYVVTQLDIPSNHGNTKWKLEGLRLPPRRSWRTNLLETPTI